MFEMGRLLKSEMCRDGIPMPSFLHFETLRFIQDKEGKLKDADLAATMSDVAEYLKIAPPSATSLINTFVRDGVITRISDPEDRRRVRLTLSAKGTSLLEETLEKRSRAFASIFSSLSEKDSIELARILTIITRP
jgi:DNA-binding MarR family transcriptional regulator